MAQRLLSPNLTQEQLFQRLEELRVIVEAAKRRYTITVDGVITPITTDAAWLAILAKKDLCDSFQEGTNTAVTALIAQRQQEQNTIEF